MSGVSDMLYRRSHEWVRFEDGGSAALIGITDHAQETLGGLVFVNLPAAGDEVSAGASFADVESVKAVSDIYSPVSGRIAAVNEALLEAPEIINETPYEAWIVRVEDITDYEKLMNAEEYEAFCSAEV